GLRRDDLEPQGRRHVSSRPLHDFLDATLHVEIVLGNAVVLAGEDLLEPANRVGDRNLSAFAARERLRGAERLAQESLYLPGAEDGELVVGSQLVHAENR